MAKVAPADEITEVQPAPGSEPEPLKMCQDPLPPEQGWADGGGGGGRNSRTSDGREVTKRTTGLFQFANTEAIKEKVRSQKLKPPAYNVHDRYHETGIFQKIARHNKFENFTL